MFICILCCAFREYIEWIFTIYIYGANETSPTHEWIRPTDGGI